MLQFNMCDVTRWDVRSVEESISVWRDTFVCVTWFICTCDVNRFYVWRDSFVRDVIRSYVLRDSFGCDVTFGVSVLWVCVVCVTLGVSVCCMRDTHSQSAKPASHICRLSYSHSAHRGDLLKFLHTCHDALTSVTSHTSMCNVTHSCAWRDDFDMILLNRWFRQDFEQWWWFLLSSLSLPLSFSRTLFCTLFRILSLSPCFFLILSLSFFPLFNPY